jgi:hypothetical protein
MGTHNRSEMIAVHGSPCEIPPRNSNSISTELFRNLLGMYVWSAIIGELCVYIKNIMIFSFCYNNTYISIEFVQPYVLLKIYTYDASISFRFRNCITNKLLCKVTFVHIFLILTCKRQADPRLQGMNYLYIKTSRVPRSWGSSVSIVSDYRLDHLGSIPSRGKGFFL